MEKQLFGKTKEGKEVYKYTLVNGNGMKAVLTDFGAVLLELYAPDKNGHMDDVVLGYHSLESYFENGPSFGATIGRHANRIGNASFDLNGTKYELAANDGKNNLHSNPDGYHKRLWQAEVGESDLGPSITFFLDSPDADQGYPGNLHVSVTYTLGEDNSLMIHYEGKSDADTIVNLTNHSYFNLAGQDAGSIVNHKVWIDADFYTRADEESIPTGEIVAVKNTPMDFTTAKRIGDEIDSSYEATRFGNGYDHNWILKNEGGLELVARLEENKSGRVMEVYTDLPGLQFYTANFLDGTDLGKSNTPYNRRAGVCFETQYYPDSIHHNNFPSPILKALEKYDTTTIYKFLTNE